MDSTTITLPQVLDLAAVHTLKSDLLAALSDHASVSLDASAVERVGTPGLQLLLSATTTFAEHGQTLHIQAPSTALCAALTSAAITLPHC